jgi:uncharacterized membrane protein
MSAVLTSPTTIIQTVFRLLLGVFLLLAGISHLTWSRTEFTAEVPGWIPMSTDMVIVLSGLLEIILGCSVLFLSRYRVVVGWTVALFFVLVFPGNIAQYVNRTDAFGLNSDTSRGIRLLFQPLLVIWALWSTGAWAARRR